MKYRVRITKPSVSEWSDVESSSPGDAAQEFHSWHERRNNAVYVPDPAKPGSRIHFAAVEVDGHGELVSRIYHSRIVRKGGIKPRRAPTTLEDIAKAIGWEKDPEELVAPGWNGEQEEWTWSDWGSP